MLRLLGEAAVTMFDREAKPSTGDLGDEKDEYIKAKSLTGEQRVIPRERDRTPAETRSDWQRVLSASPGR